MDKLEKLNTDTGSEKTLQKHVKITQPYFSSELLTLVNNFNSKLLDFFLSL